MPIRRVLLRGFRGRFRPGSTRNSRSCCPGWSPTAGSSRLATAPGIVAALCPEEERPFPDRGSRRGLPPTAAETPGGARPAADPATGRCDVHQRAARGSAAVRDGSDDLLLGLIAVKHTQSNSVATCATGQPWGSARASSPASIAPGWPAPRPTPGGCGDTRPSEISSPNQAPRSKTSSTNSFVVRRPWHERSGFGVRPGLVRIRRCIALCRQCRRSRATRGPLHCGTRRLDPIRRRSRREPETGHHPDPYGHPAVPPLTTTARCPRTAP